MISNTSLNTYFPGRSTLRHLFGRVILEEKIAGIIFYPAWVTGTGGRQTLCLLFGKSQ